MNQKNWLLVLGANSDIGVAIARRFAQSGWNIILASRNIELLEREAQHLRLAYNVLTDVRVFDAKNTQTHNLFFQNLPNKPFGIVLSFGLLGNQLISQRDFEQAEQVIQTNYIGAVSICEVIATDLEKKSEGFIVGISSVAGDRGRSSNYIYGSAKAGFTNYLSGLRHRLTKCNVHVMTVKPGFVDTKMTSQLDLPKILTATPDEVAESIYSGIKNRSPVIYVKWFWFYIMLLIIHTPNFIFNKSKL